jgi:hypothetical protein
MNGVDRLFDQLPRTFFVVPILLLIVGLVFTVMAGIVALRRRESLFDVMEFDGAVLWRKARVWAVVLVALAFLVIIIINNQ